MLLPMLFDINRSYHSDILSQIARLVDEGKLRPLLDYKPFGFVDVSVAHAYKESGNAIGKVTLEQSFEST